MASDAQGTGTRHTDAQRTDAQPADAQPTDAQPPDALPTVVILYEHALLGEGIAQYLRAQIGVHAVLGSASDPEAVELALARHPDVVMFESHDLFRQFNLSALAQHAVLIDLSTVITRGSVLTPCTAGLAQLLASVQNSRSTAATPPPAQQARTSPTPFR